MLLQGILTLESGSTNVIPSLVKFSLDIRHPSTSRLHEIDKLIRAEAERIAAEDCELGCKLEWTMDTDSPAVEFHQDAVQAVRESAIEEVGLDMVEELFSGAGHDRYVALLSAIVRLADPPHPHPLA